MSGIEIFVIFAVGTLNLSVMSWCVRLDELVSYSTLFEARLEQCGRRFFCMPQTLCEFQTVIRLNALYFERKSLKHMLKEYRRAVSAVFLKSL